MSHARTRTALFAILMISGCSGDARVTFVPVLADAGNSQFVAVGTTVALDCRASSGPAPGTCAWRFVLVPSGSHAVLQNPASQTPDFVADLDGLYQVELAYTVQDITSKTQVGVVAVNRPQVSVSPDLAVTVGHTAVLEATASGTGGDTLTYAWTLTAKPAGSAASLTGADQASASFVADVAGTYVADVVVADHTVAAEPVPVTVTAGP